MHFDGLSLLVLGHMRLPWTAVEGSRAGCGAQKSTGALGKCLSEAGVVRKAGPQRFAEEARFLKLELTGKVYGRGRHINVSCPPLT